jgi:hypothetical protein
VSPWWSFFGSTASCMRCCPNGHDHLALNHSCYSCQEKSGHCKALSWTFPVRVRCNDYWTSFGIKVYCGVSVFVVYLLNTSFFENSMEGRQESGGSSSQQRRPGCCLS